MGLNVSLNKVSLDKYSRIVGERETEEIRSLAKRIEKKRFCHVNSTSFGGGVAEILHRLVPLMKDVGLDAEWKVITGSDKFFNVTKTFHNALLGLESSLTKEMKNVYLRQNEMNSNLLDLNYDYVIIHDPQPLALINYCHEKIGKWVWRCHIDLSQPNREFLDFLIPYITLYDASIFSLERYAKKFAKIKEIAVIHPSIDPLSDKNKPLSDSKVLSTLETYDVAPDRPILTQVSRFDPWKDPMGVIDVYRLVKRRIPSVQLLLIGSMAHDDPEGLVYYEKTDRYAGNDYNIHLLTNLADVKVNALQRASDVVLQKSIREGFGLTVSEALWKEVPVVGGNAGGITLQILDGKTGFLVNNVEEAAQKTLHLLKHPKKAQQMGRKGRQHVLKNFLITRHLKSYFKLFLQLSEKG
ncbi:MAG: glycosyltransferase [Thermoproteota archaeon]|nr:glycosyltransferase [Thermoproteota archaeon]